MQTLIEHIFLRESFLELGQWISSSFIFLGDVRVVICQNLKEDKGY